MIFLNQNITNEVYLTLSESITLTGTPVYFLFRFIDETTKNSLYFTAPDISTNTVRYNQFQITLTANTANQNFTAGTITMNPAGLWRYEVYQQYSPTNIQLSGTNEFYIENGIVQLSGTPNTMITNFYTGQTQNYTYYNPYS